MPTFKSLDRALSILDIFISEPSALSVSEIAKRMDMNISTVSRVLSTYGAHQLVIKSEATRKYSLGKKILQLAGVLLSQLDLRGMIAPYLKKLNELTNETVAVYIIEKDYLICLDRVESSQGIRRVLKIGEYHTVHAGAPAKLFLAHMTPLKRDMFLEKVGLPKITEHTITDRNILEQELNKIRSQGVSVSFEELTPLCAAVASPIMAFDNEMIAALAILGPTSRFNYAKVEEYTALCKQYAKLISQELGQKKAA